MIFPRSLAPEISEPSLLNSASSFALEPDDKHGGLCLRAEHRGDWKPLRINWESREQRSRILAGKKQLLARALGLPGQRREYRIIDATGGLGRDAFTLAALGANVTLVERNPLLVELLRDAQSRTRHSDARWAREAVDRLLIVSSDAIDIPKKQGPFDAALLDPMYPHDNKAALPQKEMQLLRDLVGDDDDALGLLNRLRSFVPRIAVKRPPKASHLGDTAPHFELKSTQARFDVYIGNHS